MNSDWQPAGDKIGILVISVGYSFSIIFGMLLTYFSHLYIGKMTGLEIFLDCCGDKRSNNNCLSSINYSLSQCLKETIKHAGNHVSYNAAAPHTYYTQTTPCPIFLHAIFG